MTTFKGLPSLKTKTARLDLDPRTGKRPYWATISPGVALGYRRNEGAGAWFVRVTTKPQWQDRIATADDYADECAPEVLGFESALERARIMARAPKGATVTLADNAPITVGEALAEYRADLIRRKGDIGNATRLDSYLPPAMLAKSVMMLTSRELKTWCNGLAGAPGIKTKALAPSTINRMISCLAAALALAAEDDNRIAWHMIKKGLKKFADADEPCNMILTDAAVIGWGVEAHKRGRQLGIYMDVLAETGTRPSQAARIRVDGFKDDPVKPKLLIPRSGKGGTSKRSERKQQTTVSLISLDLAAVLREQVKGRRGDAPLLIRDNGMAWNVSDKGLPTDASQHYRPHVKAIVAALVEQALIDPAELDPAEVTAYALRHSSIVRNILCGVPAHVVATTHDTSEAKIKSNYGHKIDRHADEVSARGILRREPAAANVVSLTKVA